MTAQQPAASTSDGQTAYNDLLGECYDYVADTHGSPSSMDIDQLIDAVDDFFHSEIDDDIDWWFYTGLINFSENGPHESGWVKHDWNNMRPEGALRCMAANCLLNDVQALDE